MAAIKKKIIDINGIPFIVELRDDGKYYIVGIKQRRREFNFESGLSVDIVDKIEGKNSNERLDTLSEMEEFLDDMPEDSTLKEVLDEREPEYVSDDDVTGAWDEIMENAQG